MRKEHLFVKVAYKTVSSWTLWHSFCQIFVENLATPREGGCHLTRSLECSASKYPNNLGNVRGKLWENHANMEITREFTSELKGELTRKLGREFSNIPRNWRGNVWGNSRGKPRRNSRETQRRTRGEIPKHARKLTRKLRKELLNTQANVWRDSRVELGNLRGVLLDTYEKMYD